jgi:hypothetical protein
VDLYILDALYRRQYVIDQYISLIWTERQFVYGDFQLNIYSNHQSRSLLKLDTYLALDRSNYIMRIESFEDDWDADGKRVLIIKGRSMEAILLDRVAKESLSDLTTSPAWVITDTPANIARTVFHNICVSGVLNTGDVIPGISETSLMPASTIPEPIDPITLKITPTTVYDVVSTKICAAYDLGFRMLRDDATGLIHFDVYAGSDRTTGQTTLTPVVFGPQLDNLQNTKELTTIDSAKNVAYVFSPVGFQMVYGTGVDPTVEGFERRVLVVDASDVTSGTVAEIASALTLRGMNALTASRVYFGFDGEISQNSQYVYGRDYNLGDLVELQNTDGVAAEMRVTEQIFTCDEQGTRSYPTLTSNIVINTGSWLSWTNNKAWFDFDTDTTSVWGNQP